MSRPQRQSKKTIWVIEEDASAQTSYRKLLEEKYFLVFFQSADAYLEACRGKDTRKPDLLLTDCGFSGECFVEKYFKPASLKPPFFVVTSVTDIDILRVCFDAGASDYLPKPLSQLELQLKLERFFIGKRKKTQPKTVTYSHTQFKLRKAGSEIAQLTAKESQIFQMLKLARGKTVSRERILSKIWKGKQVAAKAFDVHLFNLRKKLLKHGIEIDFFPPDCYQLKGFR